MHEPDTRALDEAPPARTRLLLLQRAALLLLGLFVAIGCVPPFTDHGDDGATAGDTGDTGDPGGEEPPPLPEPEPPLLLKNSPRFPTRIAVGTDGKVYVSDAKVGSVFIYESDAVDGKLSLNPTGELKGLDKPLGVAVDAAGNIYVGNDGMDNVEKYDRDGNLLSSVGSLRMPTDLALDRDGNLYVADSQRKTVEVFDPDWTKLRTIGVADGDYGGVDFPVAVSVAYRPDPDNPGSEIGEVFVACQTTYQIHVFDLEGTFQRTLGSQVTKSFWGSSVYWEGAFQRIQDLAVDSKNRIHVLDCALNNVQVLDPVDGSFLDSYGPESFDPDGEFLKVPLGLALTGADQTVVANTHRRKLETFGARP